MASAGSRAESHIPDAPGPPHLAGAPVPREQRGEVASLGDQASTRTFCDPLRAGSGTAKPVVRGVL
jgi:hypothetical protein